MAAAQRWARQSPPTRSFYRFAPASFDLVVASLSLHWVNDLPGRADPVAPRRAAPGPGCCWRACSALGTLGELRQSADPGGGSADRRGLAARLAVPGPARGLRRATATRGLHCRWRMWRTLTLLYADRLALLSDLRAAGRRTPCICAIAASRLGAALFPAALALLPDHDGRIAARTLRLAMLTGWAPSPKPAEAGSAR